MTLGECLDLCLEAQEDGDIRTVDLPRLLTEIQRMAHDHGLRISSVNVRCRDFQAASTDPAIFGRVWGSWDPSA